MKRVVIVFLTAITVFILVRDTLAQIHAVNGEYITEWLVLGPFFSDLSTDFWADVEGEANRQPQGGQVHHSPMMRPLSLGQDVFLVKLKAGINQPLSIHVLDTLSRCSGFRIANLSRKFAGRPTSALC